MFTLIIEDKNGALVGEYTFEDGEFILGRSQQADIQLAADNVSRRHARIFIEDGRCYIEDLKAANGVWVNGRRIHTVTELPRSAQVRIGDFFLHIEGAAFARPMTSPVYARLVPMPGSSGQLVEMTLPTMLIGRGKDCAVVLDDVSVSRIHAKLTQDDASRVMVEDLRSSNGTYVNDRRIDVCELQHGDRIRFGTVAFSFQIEGMPDVELQEAASQRKTTAAPAVAYAQRAHAAFAPIEHPPEPDYPPQQRMVMPTIVAIALGVVALVTLVVVVGLAVDRWVTPRLDPARKAGAGGEAKADPAAKSDRDPGDDDDRPRKRKRSADLDDDKSEEAAADAKRLAKAQYDDQMARGKDALLRRQWAEAKGHFDKARRLDVVAAEPQEFLNKINLEEQAGANIAQAEEAFKRHDLRAAIRAHKLVPASSVYGVDAQRALSSLAMLAEDERQKSCHGKSRDLVRCIADCELVISTGFANSGTIEDCTRLAAGTAPAGGRKK